MYEQVGSKKVRRRLTGSLLAFSYRHERVRSFAMELLGCYFNQDYGCFACGTSNGFCVFNSEPFQETFRREFDGQGVRIAVMLFRCNILALVGGGSNPRFPASKVMIWDDHQGRCIGELGFRSQVRAVKLRRDKIAVALEHKVLVYNFMDLKLVHTIETQSNPAGLLALSAVAESTVLACPGLNRGQVRVELSDVRRTKFIQAHTAGLACLALSLDGKLLATASARGTLVRVFHTSDGSKLQELRRGADPACIHSIAFSKGDCPDWLAVSSDKGTIHVFSLQHKVPAADAFAGTDKEQQQADSHAKNPLSPLSFVSSILPVPYFASERSFAQFRLPEETRAVVGFGQRSDVILIASAQGSFYTASFDPARGGSCTQQSFHKFVDVDQQRH